MRKISIGDRLVRLLSIGLIVASVLVASARPADPAENTQPIPTVRTTPGAQDTFLWLRNIDGFNAIDDEHIVLHAGNKHALVRTFGPCFGLRDSETIKIDAPLGHLDASGLGHIIYRRPPRGRGRCPIDKIVSVSGTKEAKEIVEKERAGKKAGNEAR